MTHDDFEDFVQSIRDAVSTLGELPETKINVPLALLEMRLRLALESYDKEEEHEQEKTKDRPR